MKMLHYSRINFSEGIVVKKTSPSKECIIYHYLHILGKVFQFQPSVCNGFHVGLIMSMKLSNFDILNIYGIDYCSIIDGTSKGASMNLLRNDGKKKELQNITSFVCCI